MLVANSGLLRTKDVPGWMPFRFFKLYLFSAEITVNPFSQACLSSSYDSILLNDTTIQTVASNRNLRVIPDYLLFFISYNQQILQIFTSKILLNSIYLSPDPLLTSFYKLQSHYTRIIATIQNSSSFLPIFATLYRVLFIKGKFDPVVRVSHYS